MNNDNIWRFLITGLYKFKLTIDEIERFLSSSFKILETLRATDFNFLQGLTDRSAVIILRRIKKRTRLSRLHAHTSLIFNDRYLSFLLWDVFDLSPKKILIISSYLQIPQELFTNLNTLIEKYENVYWVKEDITRYAFAFPLVCVADFFQHPWGSTFTPIKKEIRQETRLQLKTLEHFKTHYIETDGRSNIELWSGFKNFNFEDSSNYLQVNYKAPPAIIFKVDQDLNYFREGVIAASNRINKDRDLIQSLLTFNIFDDSDHSQWQLEYEPEGLPDINWSLKKFIKDRQRNFYSPRVKHATPLKTRTQTEHASPSEETRTPDISATYKEALISPPKKTRTPDISATYKEARTSHMNSAILKGSRVSLSKITEHNVCIKHRNLNRIINRAIFTESNSGVRFKNEKSQQRADYGDHPK